MRAKRCFLLLNNKKHRSTEIVYIHIDKVGAGVEIDMPDLLLDV